MRRYLVVANQTATGAALRRMIEQLVSEGPCEFRLVVPATQPRDHATWTEGSAVELAHRRLDESLEAFRDMGAQAQGWVGDADPYQAIVDALRRETFDEVVLSTFAPGMSRWLRMDVASRARRNLSIPVRVVHSDRVTVRAG